jgi:alpha-glucosidase (family GH31 glycosyl hydrolase)
MVVRRRWRVAAWLAMVAAAAGFGAVEAGAQHPAGELEIRWEEVAPGVWRGRVGEPERVTLLSSAGVEPRREAMAQLPSADSPPLPLDRLRAERIDGRLAFRIPLGSEEQLFGLGLNFERVQQRGVVKELHVDHYGGTDNGRTHAPVPFYVSSGGYGVLLDVARYVTVYAGTAVRKDSPDPPPVRDRNTDRSWSSQPRSDAVEMLVDAPGADLYLFAGPAPLDVVRRYNLYSGGGALPPKWGLGFMHRVPTLYSADQVLQEVDEFATHGYPLDVIGLEPGWQSAAYPGTFVWDPGRFPDPSGFIGAMRERGVDVNLWLNPYVAPSSPLYPALEPLSGSHTVWTGIVPDLTLEPAREAMLSLFAREHLDRGVSGYKIDEVDGYDRWVWPDHATFPSGLSGEQMRQVYGLEVQRMTAEMFRSRNQRTWGLVRASNAGAASFPYVIYNDYYDHRDFITALVSSSFVGVLWTPEVRRSPTGEEWLRRMQSVCFSPLAMLNAWADGTKPWTFPEVADEVREVMTLRVRMLPYLYTAFARYHYDGTPPFRAMPLVEGFRIDPGEERGRLDSTENPYAAATRRDIRDQYLAGEDILVAPMFAGDTIRQVVLPEGRWFDFYTGAFAGEGEVITVKPGLERIPLFVRDGAVIPMLAEGARQVPGPGERPALEVRHYGEAPGEFVLYDDDGLSFAYEEGGYSWTSLRVERGGDGRLRGSVGQRQGRGPFGYGEVTFRMMTGGARPM